MSGAVPVSDLQQLHGSLKTARHLSNDAVSKLSSGIVELDQLVADQLVPGNLIEWGLPQGRHGRQVPLLFLRHEIPASVWIYADTGLSIYAPAWASQGVDLRRLFFIRSNEPVRQLRPLFLDNSFRIIVIDSPEKLSRGELAFLHVQARINGQIIFIIRDYFLSQKNGTPLAALRLNCWKNNKGQHSINIIKGVELKKITLALPG